MKRVRGDNEIRRGDVNHPRGQKNACKADHLLQAKKRRKVRLHNLLVIIVYIQYFNSGNPIKQQTVNKIHCNEETGTFSSFSLL